MRAGQVVAVLAGCALVLAGCRSGAGADPSPSPVPTYECTAPGSCTPQQAAKEQAAAKAHREAEAALKAGMAELSRLSAAGDAEQARKKLGKFFAGQELDGLVKSLSQMKTSGRVGHGTITIEAVTFQTAYPEDSEGAKQTLHVCEDGSEFFTTDSEGMDRSKPGVRLSYTAYMTYLDGQWKRTGSTKGVEVASCG